MENSKIEKISEIIASIIRISGGTMTSKTKLMKIIYLVDIIFARKYQKTFSGSIFKSYYYGPYSEEVKVAMQFLENLGYITVKSHQTLEGDPHFDIQLNQMPFFGHLTSTDKIQLQSIVTPLINFNANEIVDMACHTREYQRTDFTQTIQLLAA
jgi:uncharacterized protein YwgA